LRDRLALEAGQEQAVGRTELRARISRTSRASVAQNIGLFFYKLLVRRVSNLLGILLLRQWFQNSVAPSRLMPYRVVTNYLVRNSGNESYLSSPAA
jgi:hypothetical protein